MSKHLATCPTCSNELESLRDTVALSREAAMLHLDDRPPDRIWDGIVGDLDTGRSAGPAATSNRRPALLAAAALLVGILATLAVVQPWQPDTQVRASGALAAGPGSPTGVLGTVQVLERHGRSQLKVTASGLPAGSGFYEVWLFDPVSKKSVAMGDLAGDGTGAFPMPPGIDTGRYHVVAVSAEAYDGNPAPSTHSVLRGGLPR